MLSLVEVGPRQRYRDGAAVSAKEVGDGGLPGLRGLGGVDQVAGLLIQALLHEGHDLYLAAVE
ncbi:hypothetical protein [Streptomyces viridosporus]|uniref:hypothetical protein n=1 Tax=Streptomyces viridosporus TaxID=67581 RepID=UPI00117CA560|nr:hypothetical protein [Streptomyces viridosporus]